MKSNQVLESAIDRTINGVIVRQRTKDNYFALRDIARLVAKFHFENTLGESRL